MTEHDGRNPVQLHAILVVMFLTAPPAVSAPLVPSQHGIHHRPVSYTHLTLPTSDLV